ncbi:hypothetical protein ACSLNR_23105, partial [Escherichia coli]
MFYQNSIPRRVHTGGNRPNHIVPDAAFSFRAGQYLMVVMDERDKRPFSMASTPDEKG